MATRAREPRPGSPGPPIHVGPPGDRQNHWMTPECWCLPRWERGGEFARDVVVHRDDDGESAAPSVRPGEVWS